MSVLLETEWLLPAGKTTKLYCVRAFWAVQTVPTRPVSCSLLFLSAFVCTYYAKSGKETPPKKLEAGCVIAPTLPGIVLHRSSAKDAGGAVTCCRTH
ncbi:unnamed protein product [Ixodes pacificus]